MKRSVFSAIALIGAVLIVAAGYRFLAGGEATNPAAVGAGDTLGGQLFVRHATPRPLPAVAFTDGEGRPVSLAQFRGRTVLLNVWATWCAPCRKEMPTLDALQEKRGGPDFEVVALSIDNAGPAAVRKFYEEVGVRHLRIYNDATTQVTAALSVVGVPATLLIDREGREIGRALGPAEWDAPEVVEMIDRYAPRSANERRGDGNG